MHNRNLVVTADATSACDRGCSHCAFRSNMGEPMHLKIEAADKLVSQINNLEYGEQRIDLCFTGGGEPLLNPHLSDIVQLCLDKLGKKTNWIQIVTSGFTSESEDEKKTIEKILEMDNAEAIHFCISFHAFSAKAVRRLVDTLSLLIEKGRTALVSINLCSSRENFHKTYRTLYTCLAEAEERTDSTIYHLLVETWDRKFGWQGYTQKTWSAKTFHRISANSFGIPCHLIIDREDQNEMRLVISPFSMIKHGRARDIVGSPWHGRGCPFIFSSRYRYSNAIHLSADGSLFPTCDCMCAPPLKLGDIATDDLNRILQKRRSLSVTLLRKILLDTTPFTSHTICETCQKIMWGE